MSILKDLLTKPKEDINSNNQDNGDWWKSPVLQGDDAEYGEYDYLATPIPESYSRWELTEWKCRCENCGNESHLNLKDVSYFYTYDGYDSMDYTSCWRCELKSFINRKIRKLKRRYSNV